MSESSSFLDRHWREFSDRLYGSSRDDLDFGLDRIERALELEDRPDRTSRPILVAGTNGKGGTAAHLAGILQAHGRRVGLFTSPHLLDLRERFRVNGRPISRRRLREIGEPLVDAYGSSSGNETPELTFFELTVLIAASVFADARVDDAIYEVGMGGRLDATNALDPALSIVTSVGHDHQAFLGETIEEIAAEKCGIFRPDAPAVVGPQAHAAAETAIEEHLGDAASARLAGRDYRVDSRAGELSGSDYRVAPSWDPYPVARTRWSNAGTALEAARLLLDRSFDAERARIGLERTRWPGRFDLQTVEPGRFETDRPVEFLLDAAHNPEAVRALFDDLDRTDLEVGAVVAGGMTDKDLREMFARLAGGPPVWGADIRGARAASSAGLAALLPDDVYQSGGPVGDVLGRAARHAAGASPKAVVLTFGSTYLVGAALEQMGRTPEQLVTYVPESNSRN